MSLQYEGMSYDMGLGAAKLSGRKGDIHLPAHVALYDGNKVTADDVRLEAEASHSRPLLIALKPDGQSAFWVGKGAMDWGDGQDARDVERLTDVPEARAAFYAALTRYIHRHGPFEAPLKLVAGVPFDAVSGDQGEANKRAIEGWLTGEHRWYVGRQRKPYAVTVAQARATRQGKGALYSYALDSDGRLIAARVPEAKGEIGVISIGFRTVELEIFRNYAPVPNRAGNAAIGVHRLAELAKRQERRHYKLGELDEMLRAGTLDVTEAKAAWHNDLRSLIENVWDDVWPRLPKIIVVGGGVYQTQEWLMRTFGHRCYVPSEPVLAIAQGLRRIGLQVYGPETASDTDQTHAPAIASAAAPNEAAA